jgi:hypothetical protein
VPPGVQPTFDPDGVFDDMTAVTVFAGQDVIDVNFGHVLGFNLQVTKTAAGQRQIGEDLDFEIVVSNEGPAVAFGPISLVDEIPVTLSVRGVTASGWSCTIDGQTVECHLAGDLQVGEPLEVIVHTVVGSGVGNEVTNTATVAAAGPIEEVVLVDNTDSAVVAIGELPRTGADLLRIAVVGLLLLLAGSAIVAAPRRRWFDRAA